MPVAVPTGSYELLLEIDLSPLFGRIEKKETLRIEQPGPDALDRRLRQLASAEVKVRMEAIMDLRNFPKEGGRIVPALLGRLEDGDERVRGLAIGVLMSFPTEVVKHLDRFLPLARGGEGIGDAERVGALWLLARFAPVNVEVEKLLEAAASDEDEEIRKTAEFALRQYRQRKGGNLPPQDLGR